MSDHGRAVRYSRVKFSQSFDSLVTISHDCGVACLLVEKPGAEGVTRAKDARVRERRRGECQWVAEEEKDDVDYNEASEYYEELTRSHGYWE